jgi:hypothetical protein
MRNILLRSFVCLSLSVVLYSTHAQTTGTLPLQGGEWNHDLLSAKWKTGDMIYDLKKDGASMVTVSGRECPGTWTVKGNKVTITPKRLKWNKANPCSKSRTLEIENVKTQGMDVADPATGKEIRLVKVQ